MTTLRDGSLSRRAFAKAAVAVGGAGALAACLERFGGPDVPQGPEDLSGLPERQHAWNAALSSDEHGNAVPPRHHLLLLFECDAGGPPTPEDRETLETALRDVERAYARGNDGLLVTVGYAPAYFERFDAGLPDAVDLPSPRALSPFEDPALDEPDGIVHLASDHPQVVLAAEAALTGERSTLNGRAVSAHLTDVAAVTDRRTGFVGAGLPADNQDAAGIPDGGPVPEDAPLFMGFRSGFEKNQASEDRVTIAAGPFAGGTTQHVSHLRLRLEDWYDEQDHDDRVAEMFCPFHAENDRVPDTGASLGADSGMDDCPDDLAATAAEHGRVGHAQKTAAVREDGEPLILRRDFDTTDPPGEGDDGVAGVHFLSVQRAIADFEATREAMNGADATDHPAVKQRVNNGILEYVFAKRRGNYLLPPRSLRSLPEVRP